MAYELSCNWRAPVPCSWTHHQSTVSSHDGSFSYSFTMPLGQWITVVKPTGATPCNASSQLPGSGRILLDHDNPKVEAIKLFLAGLDTQPDSASIWGFGATVRRSYHTLHGQSHHSLGSMESPQSNWLSRWYRWFSPSTLVPPVALWIHYHCWALVNLVHNDQPFWTMMQH